MTMIRLAPIALVAVSLLAGGCQEMLGEQSAPPVVAAAPPSPPVDQINGRATVIEGDLLEIDNQRIRIQGIDAPDVETHPGKRALIEMRRIVGRDPVRCQLMELEAAPQGGRQAWVARCSNAETADIGQDLVRRGWARALPSDGYVTQEAEARAAGLGMWPKPAGRPVARAASAPRPAAAAPAPARPVAARTAPARATPAKATAGRPGAAKAAPAKTTAKPATARPPAKPQPAKATAKPAPSKPKPPPTKTPPRKPA